MRLYTKENGRSDFVYIGDFELGQLQGPRPQHFSPKRGLMDHPRVCYTLWRYPRTLLSMALGLILGILILALGFFQTLLLSVLVFIGYLIGGFLDRNPRVLRFLQNLG
ncbi:MAG: DUF2273 domain-containing protein [Tissierellia bacterium]|nr:DUF2273 domain-containing protein [Tissierellia bacterium]